MFTSEQLLAPVSAQSPCGEDIAFSSEVDAVARARQADDPTLEQGAWVTSLKEADWKFVAARCAEMIEKRSKDLRLAVWLAEAGAKTAGFRGLGDGLHLVAALCERYWEHLFPLPDEGGFEQRIGNLCWIAARVPQLVAELPVAESGGVSYSMLDFELARSRGHAGEDGPDLEAARRATPCVFYKALLADITYCMDAIEALARAVDERLGADGPSLSKARAALDGVIHFITPFAREAGVVAEEEMSLAPVTALADADSQIGPGPIQTRGHALKQLREVAEFFRRTEPHSPVAYLADKAADWGAQPLHVWLRGVVKDEATFAHLEELLGMPNAG